MVMFRYSAMLSLLIALVSTPVFAGSMYEVTSKMGDQAISYKIKIGGGKRFGQFTAYDPESKQFVYLSWPRKEKEPKPVCSIWDHETGRNILLYKFPNVENPLPVIPSIEAMKSCPKTGDRDFTSKLILFYD